MKTSTPSAGKPVGAALSTLKVLRFAIEGGEPFTATECARATALNPSTCFNLVQTMVAEGFLEPVSGSKRYVVGNALRALARRIAAQAPDFSAALPLMQALADRYKVSVTLWKRRSPTRMELLLLATSNTAVNIQMPLGQRLPLLVGGMGRVMALQGGLSEEERQAAFDEIRWHRPLTYTAFMTQARQARRQGWGLDDGYMHRSVTALAVPVLGITPHEPTVYTCSVTMFRHQYADVVLHEMARALQAVAAHVSAALQPGE